MTTNPAMESLLAERRRQVEIEGWTSEHDDEHSDGEMLQAARIYQKWDVEDMPMMSDRCPLDWPWDVKWWKPRDRRSNLVRAGALCLAEKDRLVRAGQPYAHVEQQLGIVLQQMESV